MTTLSLSLRSKIDNHVRLLVWLAGSGSILRILFSFYEYSFLSQPFKHLKFGDVLTLFSNLSGYMLLAEKAYTLLIVKIVLLLLVIVNLVFVYRLNKAAIITHFFLQVCLFVIPVLLVGLENHSGLSLVPFGKLGIFYFVFQSLTFITTLLFFYLFGRVLVLLNRSSY